MKRTRQPNPVQRSNAPDNRRWDIGREHDKEVIYRNIGTKRALKLLLELNKTGHAHGLRSTQPRPANWWHPHPGSF